MSTTTLPSVFCCETLANLVVEVEVRTLGEDLMLPKPEPDMVTEVLQYEQRDQDREGGWKTDYRSHSLYYIQGEKEVGELCWL